MGKMYVDFDNDIARYVCTKCDNCTSITGKSLCEVKSRGCCWYFPEFTLVDIHRMAKSAEGIQVLNAIRQNPSAIVYQYHIHAKGFFDKSGYDKYIENGLPEDTPVKDHTVFFRACPFVKAGFGCTLPPHFRNHICNFFLCSEIFDDSSMLAALKPYKEERSHYAGWVEWEDNALRFLLSDSNVDLISNFYSVIEVLKNTPLSTYEFPLLAPVDI